MTPASVISSQTRQASSPLTELVGTSLKEEIDRVLSTLTPREEKVLRMRLGIGEKSNHTLEEVGHVLGLTRERIRQIEAKALRKLQYPQGERYWRASWNKQVVDDSSWNRPGIFI